MRRALLLVLALLLLPVPLTAVPRVSGQLVVALGEPDHDPRLGLVNPVSGEVKTLQTGNISGPHLSQQGRMVLYSEYEDVHVVKMLDLSRTNFAITVLQAKDDSFPVCWQGPDHFLVMVGYSLCRSDLVGHVDKPIARIDFTPLLGDVTPDGHTLYFQDASEESNLKTMDLRTGTIHSLFPGAQLKLSRDGRWLVFLDPVKSRLDLYSTTTHSVRRLQTVAPGTWVLSPVFSPDGLAVAYLSGTIGGSTAAIHIVSVQGVPIKTIPLPDTADALDWGPGPGDVH